jgi:hypothetical protein
MEVAGLGKLSPNMLLIGFQEKWSSHPEDAREYVKTLQSAFDLHLSVGIFRLQGGFDISSLGGLAEAKDDVQARYVAYLSIRPLFSLKQSLPTILVFLK